MQAGQTLTSKINASALAADHEELKEAGSFTKLNWFKVLKGESYFHILPPWPGNSIGLPYFAVSLHFLEDENGKKHTFHCSKPIENKCCICSTVQKLANSSDESDKSLGNKMKAARRFLYNATNNKHEIGILTVGPQLHQEIVNELRDDLNYGGDPVAYVNGLLIRVTRSGTTWKDTEYRARADRTRINLPAELSAGEANLTKLDEIYPIYTDAELELVLRGNFDPKGIKKRNTPVTVTSTIVQPVSSIRENVRSLPEATQVVASVIPSAVADTIHTPPPSVVSNDTNSIKGMTPAEKLSYARGQLGLVT